MALTRSAGTAPPSTFDPTRCRPTAGGRSLVLMSHHYAIACARLAEESGFFQGEEILRRAVETTLLDVLRELMPGSDGSADSRGGRGDDAARRRERAEVCRSYWAACGMGDLRFLRCDPDGGTAEMRRSHVDEGWRRRWGPRDRPVNLLARGFLAAAWSAIGQEPAGTYEVRETRGLVSGAPASHFQVERKK